MIDFESYKNKDVKALRKAVVRNKKHLPRAVLAGTDLSKLDLSVAYLRDSNLEKTNLEGVNLSCAYMPGANLTGAILLDADLTNADLTGAILPDYQICQIEQLFGYKSVKGGLILKLLIPLDVARTGVLASNKCRAERAMVVGVYREDGVALTAGELGFTPLISHHDYKFTYKIGEYAIANGYNPDPRVVCTHGIHFFLKFEDAVKYLK